MNNWTPYANKYVVRFYPDTPILCYTYSVFEVAFTHLQPDERQQLAMRGIHTFKTGNMDGHRYDRLKRSIQEEGILNPFIVEYYDKPPGAAPSLAIRTGNNRACVMEELGMSRASMLAVVPRSISRSLPDDPYEELEIAPGLLDRIDALWVPVVREPEDDHDGMIGTERAWTDSNLLLAIVQSTVPNPNCITRVKQRR